LKGTLNAALVHGNHCSQLWSYLYLYCMVTPLFFLVHIQSRHSFLHVYKDPCIAVESLVQLQLTCSYHLSLRISEPDCCAFTCCTTNNCLLRVIPLSYISFVYPSLGIKSKLRVQLSTSRTIRLLCREGCIVI